MKVIDFPASEAPEKIVEIIETALAEARDGRLVDIAVVAIGRDEDGMPTVKLNWYGEGHYAALLGGLHMCSHAMNKVRHDQYDGLAP